MAKYPSIGAVARWHDRLIELYGGDHGVLDANLLASSLASPRFAALYRSADIIEQGATLCFSIAKNHSFKDGNKRTALAVLLIFLRRNGYRPTPQDLPWEELLVAVADNRVSREELVELLRTHVHRG